MRYGIVSRFNAVMFGVSEHKKSRNSISTNAMITISGCHTKHVGQITRQFRVNNDIKLNYEFFTPDRCRPNMITFGQICIPAIEKVVSSEIDTLK